MSILSGFLKTKKYRKTNDGYKLQSEWTSASTVEMSDGKNLQDQVNELNTNLNDFIMIKDFASSDTTVKGNSTSKVRITTESVEGYKPILGIYSMNSFSSDILPYRTSSSVSNKGEVIFNVRNIGSTDISTRIVCFVIYERIYNV